jgi:hypothetical protein
MRQNPPSRTGMWDAMLTVVEDGWGATVRLVLLIVVRYGSLGCIGMFVCRILVLVMRRQ